MHQRWPVRRSSCYSRSGVPRHRSSRCWSSARKPCPAGGRGHRFLFLLIFAGIAGLLILINAKMKPLVESAVAQQAGEVSVQAVNQAVQQALSENALPQNYLEIIRSESGEIQSIDTDTQSISAIKSRLNLQIQQALDDIDVCSVGIPLGTLLGGNLLCGTGPEVHLRFTVAANAYCSVVSKFDSAGVNQTRHSLSLEVTTEVFAMIPGSNAKTTTVTSFPIAETIIVGAVPDLYWSGSGYSSAASAEASSADSAEN